jgi:nucleotide-binding universal stress UspA family protein
MFRAQKILVAVDFSETSDRAVATAVELASKFDGRVVLLHAYEIPALGFPDGVLVASSEVVSRISSSAQSAITSLADKYKGRAPIETIVRTGVPYESVNAVAEEINADVIVIGTHGRRGIARALLGSVAENVIRTATRPVLVVHGPRE